MMNCNSCGHSDQKNEEKDENKDQYKCGSCGSVSKDEAGECCGSPREKICSCGSGKLAKECCQE